jgi:hypothetical protein
MNNDVDQYAQQKSLFGDEPATPHPKGFREELHAREKDNIPNPNRHPGQFAPKGGSNPLLKVVEHEHGWTASAMLKDGKEFRVEGKDRREAIGNAIRAGERMGVIFDPPAAEPKIGGLFSRSLDEKAHPRETKNHDGKQAGQFAPKHQADDEPFVLQRPKKNTTVPSFGSNTNTKQSTLFDVGKKNELPGQELLFNSDAGDLNNPKTMENKAKPVSRESFMAQQGAASMGHSEPALHRLPGVKDTKKQELIAGQTQKAAEWQSKRDVASAKYDEAVQRGEVREPTRIERLATAAGGHPDNESTQAAIRLLSKTIAEEQVKNNENIGITMERHGVTIKGHPNYRLIRKQVMDNTDALREQAKPQPSPARQRAMDAQMAKAQEEPQPKSHPFEKSPRVKEDFDNAVKSLAKDSGYVNFTMYEQHAHPDFLPELLKHIRDNHLELFEKIVRMSSGKGVSGARKLALKKIEAPSEPAVKYSRAYEQFEEEAERYFRDYTLYDVDRYGMGGGIMKLILSMMAMHAMSSMINNQSQAGQQGQKPSAAAPTTPSNQDFEKLHPRAQTAGGGQKPGQFTSKPDTGSSAPTPSPQPRQVRPLTERPDIRSQQTTPFQAQQPPAAPQQPIQTPTDPNTARIAEIWHGKDSGQAEDFGAGIDITPQPLKTEPAGPNPRKKTLPDGVTPNPAYNPQQINPPDLPAKPKRTREAKPVQEQPAKPSLLDREVSDTGSNADIFENPAAKARREKAELDRITKFDPTEFSDGIEQPDAPMARPTIQSTQGDYTALEAARNERAKQVRAFTNWENTTQKDPETNIADVATEHELDHEPFSKYAQEMQAFEESEWKRREGVKTAIRKAWKVDGSDLRTMENRNQDHSNLQRGDELKGSVNDSDLYEFLGPDEGEWSQNAWAMLREEPPERPGAHSKEWLQSHAENFKRLQSMIEPDVQNYVEPEDGMPFSRKSLTREIDRYFRQHLSRIRATKANSDSQSWTALDSWL